MKCSYCNKEIEEWLDDNTDAEGNKYCADCVAKIQNIAEQTGESYD
jgi:DNA-directed RNA polymerase subunit RPC12/RpoP